MPEKLTALEAVRAVRSTRPEWSEAFVAFAPWLLDRETEFEGGHWGDFRFVRWEKVPGDAGGLTKFGIDQRSHPSANIYGLTVADALEIYWHSYWCAVAADTLPEGYREIIVDTRVNGGDPVRTVQRGLNKIGAGLRVDGDLGRETHKAMLRYGKRGWKVCIDVRRDRFFRLAKTPEHRKFLNGWLARMDLLERYITTSF